ncbi:MAG: glycosyltransferase [Polyangiaceae bacterium]|nr:glycosyltransferase [Polyangiaceae bacterium]
MIEIKVDRIQAMLVIVAAGRVDADELERSRDELAALLASLQGRAIVIKADVRGIKPLSPQAAELIRRGHDRAFELGVRRVAHVVGSEVIALQMARIAREGQGGVRCVRCFWDEAAALEWLLSGDAAPSSPGRGRGG